MSLHLTLREVAEATGGQIVQGKAELVITGASNDSRAMTEGDLFVALVAERDGHDFTMSATEKGAVALLVQKPVQTPTYIGVVQVEDTFRAMGDLGAYWRQRFDIPVIGITGSNGKTSTKEILASILQQHAPALSTAGNFNNLLGLPLTLFRLSAEHQYAVLEMGMNAPGEIARLAEIGAPQIGVITSVAAAHLEGLGTVDNVAKAKGELFDALLPEHTAVIQADDAHVLHQSTTVDCQKIYVTSRGASVPEGGTLIRGEGLESLGAEGTRFRIEGGVWGSLEVTLPLLGRHQVDNALCAVAVAHLLNIPAEAVVQGLAAVQPAGRRSRLVTTEAGLRFLDDCYNSNPASARAGLETLKTLAGTGKTIAILGDMLEMGERELLLHGSIGEYAGQTGIDVVFGFGPRSRSTVEAAQKAGVKTALHFEEIGPMWEALQAHLEKGVTLLVKGSRGMRLERISQRLEEWR